MMMAAKLACLVLVGIVGVALAAPQYNRPSIISAGRNPDRRQPVKKLPAHCRLEWKVVNTIEEREVTNKICKDVYKKECYTKQRRQCDPYQDEQCETKYERQCSTLYKDNCYEAYKDVREEYTEQECQEKYVRKCEKQWITVSGNEKVWGEDPDSCKDLQETVCRPVTKYRNKKEPYRKCEKEPYQDCKEVPRRNCWQVTKERCWNQDYNECNNVPHKECHDEHKLVPYQSSRRKAFRICDGDSNPYEMSRKELEDYDYFDTRSGDDDNVDGAGAGDGAAPDQDAEYVDVDALEEVFGKTGEKSQDDHEEDEEVAVASSNSSGNSGNSSNGGKKSDSAIVFG